MRPVLFTFDVFGTLVDWQRGLRDALAVEGVTLEAAAFDRVIDWQGAKEQRAPGLRYRAIVEESLNAALGLPQAAAARVAAGLGSWPLFPDAAEGLRRLRAAAPRAATTNSDLEHRAPIEAQLGFALEGWICAEEVGRYKPDPAFWKAAARRSGVPFSREWWHVSAYADYDLLTARELGLTCVLVERPHLRRGEAHHVVRDLLGLAELVEGLG